MAADKDDGDLPKVWPFTLAGVFVLVGIVWFLLGFAVHDVGKTLPVHYTVWWASIVIAVVLVIGGGIYNTLWSHRRNAAL